MINSDGRKKSLPHDEGTANLRSLAFYSFPLPESQSWDCSSARDLTRNFVTSLNEFSQDVVGSRGSYTGMKLILTCNIENLSGLIYSANLFSLGKSHRVRGSVLIRGVLISTRSCLFQVRRLARCCLHWPSPTLWRLSPDPPACADVFYPKAMASPLPKSAELCLGATGFFPTMEFTGCP